MARPSHFLCIPIPPSARPQLEQSLAHLRSLTGSGDSMIPVSAYRPLGVLHLTLGVMSLTRQRRQEALQLLQATDLAAILRWAGDRPTTTSSSLSTTTTTASTAAHDPGNGPTTNPAVPASPTRAASPPATTPAEGIPPLTISLRGLAAFPDVKKATVLHARPHDSSGRLYYFCLAVRQVFVDAGLMAAEERPLVLHMTVVNTVYGEKRKERHGETRAGRGVGRVTMDARGLIRGLDGRAAEEDERVKREEVPAFVWAEGVDVGSVRICEMGAKPVEDKGLGAEYAVVGEKLVFG